MEEVGPKEPLVEDINEQHVPILDTVELVTSTKEAIIFLHALSGVSTPQILKIKGYIKHHQLVVFIGNNNTHNFINRSKEEFLCIFIHLINKFQVLITNGGMMKCGGCCENVKIQMGDYHLKTHMFFIDMGVCDIVLGAEWIHTLEPITIDFQELYMSFVKDCHTYLLQGIKANPPKIISSYRMEKILKKGHAGIISHLHALQLCEIPALDPPS